MGTFLFRVPNKDPIINFWVGHPYFIALFIKGHTGYSNLLVFV